MNQSMALWFQVTKFCQYSIGHSDFLSALFSYALFSNVNCQFVIRSMFIHFSVSFSYSQHMVTMNNKSMD